MAILKFVVALVLYVPIEVPFLPAPEPVVWAASETIQPIELQTRNDLIAEHPSPSFVPLLLISFGAWIVLVVCQIARLIASCRNVVRLRNGCHSCENRPLLDRVARFCKLLGISSPPPLLETVGQGSPLLVGILWPAIVLPTTTLSRLDDSERALVLGHELAHASRRDLLWNLIAASVRTTFFFHPLAWFSERQLGLTQEIAADELAIDLQNQTPVRYASLLLSIVSKLGPVRMVPTMSVGAAGFHSSLKQRISAMRFMKQASPRFVFLCGLTLGLGAALGLMPWSFVATTASAADEADPKETIVKGKYVSFKDGVLKVQVKDDRSNDATDSEWKVAEDTRVVSYIRGEAKEGTARDAFKLWEPKAVIAVSVKDGKVTVVELGIKKSADRIPDRVPDKTPDKAADKTPDRVPEQAPDNKADKVVQKSTMARGRFVSIKNRTLTIQANSGDFIENKVSENTKTSVWDNSANKYVPAGTAAALEEVKVGTLVIVDVANENITLRIGSRKGSTVGTFVSYKDDRLLMLGKDLGERFTKKYGNNVHFNKFRADVPAYESVDGGEYKLIGMANEVLGSVKEGTLVTVHGEGDDNITLVQIGVPKKE